jgi:mRNA-degrading endonuclease RelE of RelBE toxin-antitoxin system
MDKIKKALNKLTNKEREKVKEILQEIERGSFDNLDIKKLKARQDIFRVRKGNIRIIYQEIKDKFSILTIEKRSDKTYK